MNGPAYEIRGTLDLLARALISELEPTNAPSKHPSNESFFLHYYDGTDEQSGAIRLSTLSPRENSVLEEATESGSRDAILVRHMRVFGRSYTLLSWLEAWISTQAQHATGLDHRILFEIHNDPLSIVPNEDEVGQSETKSTVVRLPQILFDTLAPLDLCLAYSRACLTTPDASYELQRLFRDTFIAQRGQALALLDDTSRNRLNELLPPLSGKVAAAIPGETLALQILVLGALQSILVFQRLSSLDRQKPRLKRDSGTVSCLIERYGSEAQTPKPLLIAVRCHVDAPPDDVEVSFTRQREAIQTCVGHVTNARQLQMTPDRAIAALKNEKILLNTDVQTAIQLRIADSFAGPMEEYRTSLAILFVGILHYLRNEQHEGEKLDFWLVAGDRSLIEDSNYFSLRALKHSTVTSVMLPGKDVKEESIPKYLDRAAQAIGKLNYPWFQEGRYALFWDAVFPHNMPIGLLEVKNSTWSRWEATAARRLRARETLPRQLRYVQTPHLILGHVKSDGTGGLLIGDQPVLTARTQYSHWDLAGLASKELDIAKHLGLEKETSSHVTTLANVLARISEDPRKGCMLVVLKDDLDATPFENMGDLWEPDPTLELATTNADDLVALLAMDGATCVQKLHQVPRLTYRRLVGPHEVEPNLRKQFQDWIYDNREKIPLVGLGSRRWSAAFAALSPSVECVVVVSQDGDLHLWRHQGPELVFFSMQANESHFLRGGSFRARTDA